MKLTAIRLARKNLRSHRGRSRLSTVGIVISVFLVSLVFIISDSLKANIQHQLTQLDNSSIIINGASDNTLLNLQLSAPRDTLTNDDVKDIDKIKNITVNSSLILQGNLEFDKDSTVNSSIIATSFNNPSDLNLELVDGNWFDGKNKKWVVLGEDLANQLIGTNQPQNQVIDIKGEKFTVVGVIKQVKQPLSILGYNVDKSAFISLENGQKLSRTKTISQISVTNVHDEDDAKRKIATILSDNHADSSEFSTDTSSNIARQLTTVINYLTIGASIMAGVILIVSSISVANIMLVNVVERRREIGIRKAVGATTRNIMGQFVAESLIMSLRGGVIGLILAYGVAGVGLLFASINLTFSWWALGIGFIAPIIVGMVAGVYPAYRAAKQDIIAALNQLT
ncbi:MAG: ABC transporter permease [Candidatus Saccharibacteria bacterium]|nr:ABC transporter permease [Candidatus Saccharibacteria bacterium]